MEDEDLLDEKNVVISVATASTMFPGFRFCPTDEELISYYLKKKVEGSDKCVEVISEVEIWDLPGTHFPHSFFFSLSQWITLVMLLL